MSARTRLLRLAAALAALALLALLVVPRLDIRLDLSFFVPDKPPPQALLLIDRLRDTGGDLVLIGISGAPPETLAEASTAIVQSLRGSPAFARADNGHSVSLDRAVLEPLLAARYLLSASPEAAFTAASLRRSLQARLAELASSRGWMLRDLLLRDPTATMQLIARDWQVQGPERRHGVWMNATSSRSLVIAKSAAAASDLPGQAEVAAAIDAAAGPWRARGLTVEASGPGLLALATSRIIRDEMVILSAVGSLLVAGLLLLAFRSPSLLLVLGLPLAFAVLAGAAAVQLLFGHVHGVALTFGATLMGVAIDYPLHLAVHLRGDERPAATARRLARPLLLSALTTVGGFAAIAMSDFPGLAQLGTLAAAGMVVAYLLSRWLLPWLLPPGLGDTPGDRRWRVIGVRLRHLRNARPGVLMLLGLLVVGAVLRPGPLWETSLANLGALSTEMRDRDRLLRADLRAPDVRFMLVVRGEDEESVLQCQEGLRAALEAAVAGGSIGGYDMAAELLASMRLQRQRQAALPEREALDRILADATSGMGLKAGALAGFASDVENQRGRRPLILAELPAGPLRWRLEPLLRHERGGVSGLVLLRGPVDGAALARLASEAGDAVHYLDMRQQASELVTGYREAVLIWLALGAVAGMAVLLFGLRRPRDAIRVALPAVLAIVTTLALLVLAGVPLTLFHLLALLLVAGVGVDYALFFIGYSREAGSGERSLRSIMLCNASTAAVFATLAFSSMPVLNGIGLTVALGVVLALLMTLVFVEPDGAVSE